ncbi:hypothetical protein GQ55_9G003700 [Panicum hallii var. hallii]|uniref:Uncharacterized protein n=1 Tax=Panicum hallii var. hallii TaxID=1504633 RepID=A0A2T7BY12_9POAL|nr:hypothetical protein GQ55_9G003700 [Panicum hallii var. hallii]
MAQVGTAMDSGAAAARAAEKLCRRCKGSYDPSANTRLSCRFHPSLFVCRRHDDQKRYYELRDGDPPLRRQVLRLLRRRGPRRSRMHHRLPPLLRRRPSPRSVTTPCSCSSPLPFFISLRPQSLLYQQRLASRG